MSIEWEHSSRDAREHAMPVLTRREALARERSRAGAARPARAAAVPHRGMLRFARRVRGFAGLAIVAGVFATTVLPAYAGSSDALAGGKSDSFLSLRTGAQNLEVSSGAAGQSASTELYTSQSAAQFAASRIQSIRLAGTWVPMYQSAGDDYPWWNKRTEHSGGGLSPLGYYYRECVDFVAWRLNRDAGVTGGPWRWVWDNLASGSAYVWLSEWRSHGWPTSDVAVPGSVAWFPYNHVAYVKSVNADGTVTVEEYNWASDHLYHQRTISQSEAIYLYPPS
ncbi:MAG TPA: CHAP domain-containing protein [Microbacteriaceae bacterium]|nr:CHAP domain-containing protein [Microbacteriaceae bacterium]